MQAPPTAPRAPRRRDGRVVIHLVRPLCSWWLGLLVIRQSRKTRNPTRASQPSPLFRPDALFRTALTLAQDYDAFYCAVVEADNPQLKLLPLAVQRRSLRAARPHCLLMRASREADRRHVRAPPSARSRQPESWLTMRRL